MVMMDGILGSHRVVHVGHGSTWLVREDLHLVKAKQNFTNSCYTVCMLQFLYTNSNYPAKICPPKNSAPKFKFLVPPKSPSKKVHHTHIHRYITNVPPKFALQKVYAKNFIIYKYCLSTKKRGLYLENVSIGTEEIEYMVTVGPPWSQAVYHYHRATASNSRSSNYIGVGRLLRVT